VETKASAPARPRNERPRAEENKKTGEKKGINVAQEKQTKAIQALLGKKAGGRSREDRKKKIELQQQRRVERCEGRERNLD